MAVARAEGDERGPAVELLAGRHRSGRRRGARRAKGGVTRSVAALLKRKNRAPCAGESNLDVIPKAARPSVSLRDRTGTATRARETRRKRTTASIAAGSDEAPAATSASSAEGVLATCAAHGLTAAKALAYCPYSRFRVGAAVLWASTGTGPGAAVTAGANTENASYPVGTCAERVAIGRAVVEGGRAFRAVAVATDVSPPASPCGMCRQFIREFCKLDVPIMFDKNLDYVVVTLEQLLPMSFGPSDLHPPSDVRASV